MKTIGNILWFILGGWLMALVWYLSAIIMGVSIIGLPWCRACWEIGTMSLAPFGKDVISKDELEGKQESPLWVFLANIIWLPFGILLATIHLVHGIAMFCTIIGIPFGVQDLKLAGMSLFPVGKRVVSMELAHLAKMENASLELSKIRKQ